MATTNFVDNSYSGELLEDLLTYTATENDTYKEGLIHIKSGIQKRYTLPMIQLGGIIQDNQATPTSTHGAASGSHNQYIFTERYLDPNDFMVYIEFNPRDFEEYYKFTQPVNNLVFRELNPKIQAKMLRLLLDRKDGYIGSAIWCSAKLSSANGDTTALGRVNIKAPDDTVVSNKVTVRNANYTALGASDADGNPFKYFDGVMTRIVDNISLADSSDEAKGGKAILSGKTALTTGAQVESALYAMWKKCPKNIRKNKNLRFVCGWEIWDLYSEYLSAKDSKYTENSEENKLKFRGKEIVPISGITEGTIVLGVFSKDANSNLWMGVDYASDENVVKVERLQANSELYFFQARMKMDVNIVRPAEIVVHTPYEKTA